MIPHLLFMIEIDTKIPRIETTSPCCILHVCFRKIFFCVHLKYKETRFFYTCFVVILYFAYIFSKPFKNYKWSIAMKRIGQKAICHLYTNTKICQNTYQDGSYFCLSSCLVLFLELTQQNKHASVTATKKTKGGNTPKQFTIVPDRKKLP